MFNIEVEYEMKKERCKDLISGVNMIFIFFRKWNVMDNGRMSKFIIRFVVEMFNRKRLKGDLSVL